MAEEIYPHGFRTFVYMWLAQSLSMLGTAVTLFSINVWLAQTLYSQAGQQLELAFALSINNLAYAIPTVFVAPVAGAWADRHNRKWTMIVADAISACFSLLLVGLLITQNLQLWSLVIITAVISTCSAFHSACFESAYSMIVPEEQLPRANGMMQTMWSLASVLAPTIAATVIALPVLAQRDQLPGLVSGALRNLRDGTPLAIMIDTVSFIIASAVLLFLTIPSPVRTDLTSEDGKLQKSMGADIKEGLSYVWLRPSLLWLFGVFTAVNFINAPLGALIPLLVKFDLTSNWSALGFSYETAFALLSSSASIGGVAGGFLISGWGGLRSRRIYGVLVPLICSCLILVLLGLSRMIYLTSALVFINRAVLPIAGAHAMSILQSRTPRHLQGRVFAVAGLLARVTYPLSLALLPVVSGVFAPSTVILVLGGVVGVFCVLQFFNQSLLGVERAESAELVPVQRVVE